MSNIKHLTLEMRLNGTFFFQWNGRPLKTFSLKEALEIARQNSDMTVRNNTIKVIDVSGDEIDLETSD